MNANLTKSFSWKIALLLSLGAGLLVLGASVFIQSKFYASGKIGNEPPAIATTTQGTGSSLPTRLIIPSLGVDAEIEGVGLAENGSGEMDIPTEPEDVAWYNQGPLPGMPGSAVIAGHRDWRNIPQGVFYNLFTLKPGDLVEVVDSSGGKLEFRVVGTKTYDYNTTSTEEIFFSDSSKSRLNLITCGGDWIKEQKVYTERIVVSAELVKA